MKLWAPLAVALMVFWALSPLAHGVTNLALTATATASSTAPFPDLYYPARANDGEANPDNWREWSNGAPASAQSPEWLMYTWPVTKNIRKVVVNTHRGYEMQDFKIEYSTSGTTWLTFPNGQVTGNLELKVEILASSAVAAKYLRVLATRGPEIQPEVVRTTELEVYEDDPSFNIPAATVAVMQFQPDAPICRALRPVSLTAELQNTGTVARWAVPQLTVPAGVVVRQAPLLTSGGAVYVEENNGRKSVSWVVEFQAPGNYSLPLTVADGAGGVATSTLDVLVLEAVAVTNAAQVPDALAVSGTTLVGAINWPYWISALPDFWNQVMRYPERTPALGQYAQELEQVNDWELKWAAEHGINFFVYNWMRDGRDLPSNQWGYWFGVDHIVQRLTNPRFTSHVKCAIQFNNGTGTTGVGGVTDLTNNLAPYWINTLFSRPDYLKVDNKPVLFIYDVPTLIADLGGAANVASALNNVRSQCVAAGFAGLYVVGESRFYEVPSLPNGPEYQQVQNIMAAGMDYTYAYNNYINGNPDAQTVVNTQMAYYQKAREFNLIPPIMTASMGWSGWRNEGTLWKIPPSGTNSYQTLLQQIKDVNATLPAASGLGKKMVILDNWNEWSEGHYIAPHRQNGFGYLDAVRNVFTTGGAHQDLIPEDLGMGPYDTAFWNFRNRDKAVLQSMVAAKVLRVSPPEADLVGWWTFDEGNGSEVAFDNAGNRLGGVLRGTGATRATGLSGKALDCRGGGCVTVASDDKLTPSRITVSCWVWTSNGAQNGTYILARAFPKCGRKNKS